MLFNAFACSNSSLFRFWITGNTQCAHVSITHKGGFSDNVKRFLKEGFVITKNPPIVPNPSEGNPCANY